MFEKSAKAMVDKEVEKLHTIEQLQTKVKRLEEALRKHKHTEECFRYAAKTARASGCYHCIADCTDSYAQALKEQGE